ncbi:MAG: NosD domain-containing protein, partial [Bacteroidota bacterium]
GHTLHLWRANLDIRGFTFFEADAGIYALDDQIDIDSCKFIKCNNGVYLYGPTKDDAVKHIVYGNITNSFFYDNNRGIYLLGEGDSDVKYCILRDNIEGIRVGTDSHAEIICNEISNCSKGISSYWWSIVDSNKIHNNEVGLYYVSNFSGWVRYNLIDNNGIGAYIDQTGSTSYLNNTFINNDTGLYLSDNASIYSNIFAHNTDYSFIIDSNGVSQITTSFNDFWNNGNDFSYDSTNLSFNPRFCDTVNGNYYLASNSPCLPENNSYDSLIGAFPQGCNAYSITWHVDPSGNDTIGNGTEEYPFASIQHAINMSVEGDTVLVHDGHYYERITFDGKNIVLASEYIIDSDSSHILNTIIDGDTLVLGYPTNDTGSVVRFVNGEDSTAILQGFTVKGGIGTYNGSGFNIGYCGGGMLIKYSHPTIQNSKLIDNSAEFGGGLYCEEGKPELYGCYFFENHAMNGAEIYQRLFQLKADSCNFINSDPNTSGAIYSRSGLILLNGCSIDGEGNIILGVSGGSIEVRNSIIRNFIFRNLIEYANNNIHIYNSKLYNSGISSVCDNNIILENDSLFNSYVSATASGHWAPIHIANCYIDGDITQGTSAPSIVSNSYITGNVKIYNDQGSLAIDSSLIKDLCILHGNIYASNSTMLGGVSLKSTWSASGQKTLTNCIITASTNTVIEIDVHESPTVKYNISCCNIFRYNGGDLITGDTSLYDTSNVIIGNPYFCDTTNDNYYLYDISPAAPNNNPCGELIGKYDVYCIDNIPEITSSDSVVIIKNNYFLYHPTFYDEDGPDTVITFENIPSWLTADTDSLFGTATESLDSSFVLIVSDGYKADTQEVYIDVIHTPEIGPIDEVNANEGDTLEILITAFDGDGTIPVIVANNLPEGANFTDSANGTGLFYWEIGYDQEGLYSVTFKASDGELADSIDVVINVNNVLPPSILNLTLESSQTSTNVVNHSPQFEWDYNDQSGRYPQVWFEIEVGIDNDWAIAEMWNPDVFESPDSFVVYDGEPLEDGMTYSLRMRASNDFQWSDWFEISFRMNSLPTIPILLQPNLDIIIQSNQPVLYVQNSDDAENDSVVYDFVYCYDTSFGEPDPFYDYNQIEGVDSTGYQVAEILNENWRYWWRARAFDGYEYSEWAESAHFWVNVMEEAPTNFQAQYPPDTSGGILYDMLPTFNWTESFDYDPFDSVFYTVYIAIDSFFLIGGEIDSVYTNSHQVGGLLHGERYYWKIKANDMTGLTKFSDNVLNFRTWMLGDCNDSWSANILDITYLINFLYKGGPAPSHLISGDVNGSCTINILDITYLIAYLYKDGPDPMEGCE